MKYLLVMLFVVYPTDITKVRCRIVFCKNGWKTKRENGMTVIECSESNCIYQKKTRSGILGLTLEMADQVLTKKDAEIKRLRDAMEKAIRFSSSAGAVRDILSKGLKQALEGGKVE